MRNAGPISTPEYPSARKAWVTQKMTRPRKPCLMTMPPRHAGNKIRRKHQRSQHSTLQPSAVTRPTRRVSKPAAPRVVRHLEVDGSHAMVQREMLRLRTVPAVPAHEMQQHGVWLLGRGLGSPGLPRREMPALAGRLRTVGDEVRVAAALVMLHHLPLRATRGLPPLPAFSTNWSRNVCPDIDWPG